MIRGAWRYTTEGCERIWRWYNRVGPAEAAKAIAWPCSKASLDIAAGVGIGAGAARTWPAQHGPYFPGEGYVQGGPAVAGGGGAGGLGDLGGTGSALKTIPEPGRWRVTDLGGGAPRVGAPLFGGESPDRPWDTASSGSGTKTGQTGAAALSPWQGVQVPTYPTQPVAVPEVGSLAVMLTALAFTAGLRGHQRRMRRW